MTDSGVELLEQFQQLEGTAVVSTSEIDVVFRLPRIIATLRQEEPGIDIEIVVTNDSSGLNDVRRILRSGVFGQRKMT
ncbi:MAG: DNA-binding transcriptional LysR family regulator [Candidatus Azotimanducaceae bacterium]